VELHAWTDDDAAVLEVEDNGVGIRAEALSEIFEAFKQESEGLTREYEGSGLGLPIVQRLVEALDGTLEVDTKKGEGSRFTVRLPRSAESPSEDADSGSTDRRQEKSLQPNGPPPDLKNRRPFIFRRMYRIAADQDASFEDKTARLIDLGREYLDLPYGFLTRITDGTQEIVSASGDHPSLTPGATCPLSEAYCRKTILEETLLAIQNAPQVGWTNDPAYERFELGSYIGSKVEVGGELYGTFCFAAPEPRRTPFTTEEKTFVELLTRWASYELERHRHKQRLQRQKDRLEQFAGVVSHDLRNPLNVAQGRLSLAIERIESAAPSSSPPPADAETPASAQSHLYAVARALDRMETIIADMLSLTWSEQEFDADDMELVRLAEVSVSCWEQVRTAEATLQVEDDLSLFAHEGRLRQLLENLFRNAVEHGGDEVTVTVGVLPTGFYVEDDGPGIPEEKREKALERGYSSTEDNTGLGLPIAEAIAEAHGWTLSVTEGHAGGARFEIKGIRDPHA
jgi:signal transduction histidine kinase